MAIDWAIEVTPENPAAKGIMGDPLHKPKHPVRSYKSADAETAVKKYSPNAWGLFQMHGNVSEWVADELSANKKAACGGGWGSYEEDLASDSFYEFEPVTSGLDLGFHVARSI